MAIFSPTAKPATLVTGTVVEPAGIVITGPSGKGCHNVVALPAAYIPAARGLLAPSGAAEPRHHFFLSDEPRRRSFARVAESFLGRPLPPVSVVDQTDLPWFERVHGAESAPVPE